MEAIKWLRPVGVLTVCMLVGWKIGEKYDNPVIGAMLGTFAVGAGINAMLDYVTAPQG